MAQVYDAWLVGERNFERRVAIKRVLPELLDDTAIRRMFLDEARIVSRLHHSNIVQVIDYGTIDDAEFLAMEFVDGMDARKACRVAISAGQPMPEAIATHVIAEVAHALDYAHAMRNEAGEPLGIVHRDVNPQNILLSWAGDVKLSDFGIAIAAGRDERTATGTVKGKVGFIAPEQLTGRAVTGAADVFALGATLHALLTGESPSPAIGAAGALQVSPELSLEVAGLVRACMRPDPKQRPTAREIAKEAAAFSTRHLGGDGRSALRDWLAPLARETTQTHALDDLMRLALVPISAADPRTLRVQPIEAIPPVPATQSRRRAGRWALPLAGGVLALSATLWAAWPRAPVGPEPQPVSAGPGPEGASGPPAPVVEALPVPQSTPPEAASRTVQPIPSGKRRRTRPAQAPAEAAVGWLRVGGAQLLGAQVSIDGRAAGVAPLEQVVAAGKHRLVVQSEGRTLIDARIDVSAEHTRIKPLQVMR